MPFDNRTRLYSICPCGHWQTVIKNWFGPAPMGHITCAACGNPRPIGTFRLAYIGERWAQAFYDKRNAALTKTINK